MNIKNLIYIGFLSILLSFSSCNWFEGEEQISATEDLNNFIYEVMKNQSWYFWYDRVPDLDAASYTDSYEYLEALMYKELDNWSYLTTIEEYNAHYVYAVYYGHGFAYKFDEQSKMRISFVYPNSPMAMKGVERGWEIIAVNNTSVSDILAGNLLGSIFGPSEAGYTNRFKIVNLQQDTIEFEVEKTEVNEKTVLYKNVYQQSGGKTGYLVFKGFIEPSFEELNQAFTYFASENINNLILDLRYNGGGLMSVANYLAATIGGTKVKDKIFVKYTHNNTKTSKDYEYFFVAPDVLININKLVVIATSGTASASEAVINGLKPYMEVKIVGDNTHGKPVGMYSFEHEGYKVVPICFQIANSEGFGDYFDGLPTDAFRIDDLSRNWGDPEEASLKEALYYLENGIFSAQTPVKSYINLPQMPLKSLQAEIGAL